MLALYTCTKEKQVMCSDYERTLQDFMNGVSKAKRR